MDNGLAQYAPFIKEIKDLIYRRQYETMKKVNTDLIQLYWEIGFEINKKQVEQGWGKSVVEVLAKELQKEFPGVQGYSARNLWRMRGFYVEYTQKTILPPLGAEIENVNLKPMVADLKISKLPPLGAEIDSVNLAPLAREIKKTKLHPSGAEIQIVPLPALLADIGWKKNTVIMEKCKDTLQREFYIKMTRRYGWTKEVLTNNIENKAFEKYLINQTNFDETVPEKYRLQAKLAVKDDYNFDFLEMGTEHSEAELESAIIKKVRVFLIEMGGDFTYIGNQYYIDLADDECYIDLLLFHRRLRSLIAVDLKIGDFIPEFVGKMQYYLTVLDDKMKLPDENPSIGIIICKNKKRTRVEYALKSSNRPIGVATYSYYEYMPEEMRSLLPSPDEIAKIVHGFDEEDDGNGLLGLGDGEGGDDE